jgi:hypothetical protein
LVDQHEPCFSQLRKYAGKVDRQQAMMLIKNLDRKKLYGINEI